MSDGDDEDSDQNQNEESEEEVAAADWRLDQVRAYISCGLRISFSPSPVPV
jgi:hypothetical protein